MKCFSWHDTRGKDSMKRENSRFVNGAEIDFDTHGIDHGTSTEHGSIPLSWGHHLFDNLPDTYSADIVLAGDYEVAVLYPPASVLQARLAELVANPPKVWVETWPPEDIRGAFEAMRKFVDGYALDFQHVTEWKDQPDGTKHRWPYIDLLG